MIELGSGVGDKAIRCDSCGVMMRPNGFGNKYNYCHPCLLAAAELDKLRRERGGKLPFPPLPQK